MGSPDMTGKNSRLPRIRIGSNSDPLCTLVLGFFLFLRMHEGQKHTFTQNTRSKASPRQVTPDKPQLHPPRRRLLSVVVVVGFPLLAPSLVIVGSVRYQQVLQ
jgi:hypothetical protein